MISNKKLTFVRFLILFVAATLIIAFIFSDWTLGLAAGIIFCAGAGLIGSIRHKFQTGQPQYGNASSSMIEHYQASGLSENDIAFFRSTMHDAKEEIGKLEINFQRTGKLRAINLNEETINTAQACFKAIVDQPNKLSTGGDFLYKHLPALVDLSDKYLAINAHEIKSEDTFSVLTKCESVLTQLSQQLQTDYSQLIADDFEAISTEMAVAKETMSASDESKAALDQILTHLDTPNKKERVK